MSTTRTAQQISISNPVVAAHIAAVNRFDLAAIMATLAADPFVNDMRREFWGSAAVRGWFAKEMIGARVTIAVTEVIEHHDMIVVRGLYDGTYDKTNLPAELILTNYFVVRDEKIVQLLVIRNQ